MNANIYNVTLTLANTEYSQALTSLPSNVTIQCPTLNDIKVAFISGQSGTTFITISQPIAVLNKGIFNSTATAINLDGYTIQVGTAAVGASSTLTINPNCKTIAFPFVNQTDGNVTIGIQVSSWDYGGSNFIVVNNDAIAAHSLNWMVWCK